MTERISKSILVTPKQISLPVGRLLYFQARAHAEPLRFLLHHAGLSYEMYTVELGKWPQHSTPNGELPVFLPIDGSDAISEVAAIAAHLAGLAEPKLALVPADGSADRMYRACCDAPFGTLSRLTSIVPAEEAAGLLPAVIAATLDTLKAFEESIKGRCFFGGEHPHYGEFALMHVVELLRLNDAAAFASLGESWAAWLVAMRALPRVKEYLQSRPRAGSASAGWAGSRIVTVALEEEPYL